MKKRFKPKQKDVRFHVTVRTAQQEFRLTDENIKKAWEKKLSELKKVYYVEVLSQTILSNHVHIVLRMSLPELDIQDLKERFEFLESTLVSRRKWHDHMADRYYDRFTDLSCLMRDLNQWIAAYYNKKNGTSGHLWGHCFFSTVVGDDQYTLTAMAYADLNAVRAGIVKRAGDYPYCTAGHLKAQLDRGEIPKFPAVGFLRHLGAEHRAQAYLIWLDFMAWCEEDPFGLRPSLESLAHAIDREGVDMSVVQRQINTKEPANWSNPVFGNKNFAREILKKEGWLPGNVYNNTQELAPMGQCKQE